MRIQERAEQAASGLRSSFDPVAALNAANYHGEKACAAYLSGDEDSFCRHVAIADRLWARAAQ